MACGNERKGEGEMKRKKMMRGRGLMDGKRLLSILIAGVLMILTAGCGGVEEDARTDGEDRGG